MHEIIGGFSHIEYLIIFNTIIFGVVASEYFAGWGSMLRYRSTVKFSLIQFLWTVFSFLTLIQNWYGIWPRTAYINHHFLYFLYSIVPMLIFHLISVVLFPSFRITSTVDVDEYFKKNARLLFMLYAGYFLLTIISSYVYEDLGNVLMQNIIRAGGVVLATLAAIYHTNKSLQYLLVGAGLVGVAIFVLSIPR